QSLKNCIWLADYLLDEIHDAKVHEVIPGRKQHQRNHECETDSKPVLLRPLPQWLTPDGLDPIEQQVPPVEHWNREKIDEPQIDGEHNHKVDDCHNADLRHLAGNVSNPDDAAQLVGRTRAADHLADHLQDHAAGDPSLLDSRCCRFDRAELYGFDTGP